MEFTEVTIAAASDALSDASHALHASTDSAASVDEHAP